MSLATTIPRRTIGADLLESIRKTHPLEASIAEVLIERGIWTLEDTAGGARCE